MNNFPYFNHWVIKIITKPEFEFTDTNLDSLLSSIIQSTNLNVVDSFQHDFPGIGVTKILVLSQSHLVCHTWPEHQAIHLDLMTCSGTIKESEILDAVDRFYVKEIDIQKLEY